MVYTRKRRKKQTKQTKQRKKIKEIRTKKINRLGKGLLGKKQIKLIEISPSQTFLSPRGLHQPITDIEQYDDNNDESKAELFDALNITATQSLSASDKATNDLIEGYLQKQFKKQKDSKKLLIIFKILENPDIFRDGNNKSKKFNILTTIMGIIKGKIPWALQSFVTDAKSIAEKNNYLNDSVLQPIFKNLKEKYEKLQKEEEQPIGEKPPSER